MSVNRPRPDPLPSPRGTAVQRFWRIFRLLVLLSAVIAVIAVVLVTRGDGAIRVSLILATGFGVFFTMLLGTALMTLVFISAESGHDEQARGQSRKEEKE